MNRRVGAILSYILMIAEVLSTFLLTPYIISTLGDAEYGVYKLSASIVAYLLLLDLGIGNSVVKFVSKYRTEGDEVQCRKFLGITTIYYITIALICLVVGAVCIIIYPTAFATGLSKSEISIGQKLLFITTANAAITLGVTGFKNTISAYERFDISRGISIVSTILRVCLTLPVLKLGLGSVGIVSVNLILTIVTSVFFVCFVLFKLNLQPIFKSYNKEFLKEVITYSSFILLQMIATQINSYLGSILLGMFVEYSAVVIAIFSIGQQIAQYYQSIGSSITSVLMPGVVRMVENNATPNELCAEMVRIGRMIFMILGIIWVGFIVYGKQFILLWVGESKLDAYFVAFVFMAAYMFILTEAIGTQILWAKNEHKVQSILKMGIVLLNILLTIALIKWNPLFGATIGTTISLILGDIVVMNIIFIKKIKINLVTYYKGIFKGILPCLLISLVAAYLVSFLNLNGWIGFIVNVLIMVAIYSVSMLTFGLNQYEKKLIFDITSKFIRRYL